MNVLVVCAVAKELDDFRFPADADCLTTGVGPVEAARMLTQRLGSKHYDFVVNAGIAGGFDGVEIGSGVVVTREYYPELGRQDGSRLKLPEGIDLIDSAAADPYVTEKILRGYAAYDPASAIVCRAGEAVSSAIVTTSDERAAALRRRFPAAACESMEGFAILRCAHALGVPAVEIRGISNRVGDTRTSNWDFGAGARAARFLLGLTLQALDPAS